MTTPTDVQTPAEERPDPTPESIRADIAKVRHALALVDQAVNILATVDYIPPSLQDALRLIEPTSYKRLRVQHSLASRENDADRLESDLGR